jgi:hypothetical protein
VAYILSSNDRRDMTQGQRAIVAARINLHKLCKFGEVQRLANALKVPHQRVSEAHDHRQACARSRRAGAEESSASSTRYIAALDAAQSRAGASFIGSYFATSDQI